MTASILLIITIHLSIIAAPVESADADAGRTSLQLIRSRGFNPQTHQVTTPDGYFLTVYRIINPRIRRTLGHPVLLLHDFESSPAQYLAAAPNGYIDEPLEIIGNSIPLELAKRGYDVWLPADRGSPESSTHVMYNNTTDVQYWDFSLDDLALTDIPAVIEYIRGVTGNSKVGAIGHGQGATRLLMLLSDPSIQGYNDILYPVILLSPILYYRLALTPALQIPINSPWLIPYLKNRRGRLFQSQAARNQFVAPLLQGLDTNETRVSVYLSLASAAASSLSAAQMIENGFFDFNFHYDYGFSGNSQKYGQLIPPLYLLQSISNQYLCFITSLTDEVLMPLDFVRTLAELTLGGRTLYHLSVIVDPFSHVDFAWGVNNNRHVIQPILQLLQQLY